MSFAYFTHNLDPVIFRIYGNISINWYGLSYLMGFVMFYLLMRRAHKKGYSPYSKEQLEEFMTWGVLGVLIGGRLGSMLLYNLSDFIANPMSLFFVWEGGMAFHGGFLGVVITSYFVAKKNQYSWLQTGDMITCATAPGLFFGRIANFINGELWGHTTDVPWAVIFPTGGELARHPSQFYEAGTEGILLGIYMLYRLSQYGRIPKGQLAGEFFIAYAIARIFCEFFRVPDAALILGMSRGSFYSMLMIFAGIIIILYARKFSNPANIRPLEAKR